MARSDKNEFVRICIWYRGISLLLSTAAYIYLFVTLHGGTPLWAGLGVALGMVTACVVATLLYLFLLREGEQVWLIPVLAMELIAYGIFVNISGGLASPYLWYGVGTIFLTMIQDRFPLLTGISVVCCILCVGVSYVRGYPEAMRDYLALNTGMAVLSVIGGFYVLFIYIQRLNQSRAALARERDRSEQALRQMMDLYDAINLFAITDGERVVRELARLLGRTTAAEGCLLIKLDGEGQAELTGSSGLTSEEAQRLTDLVLAGPVQGAAARLTDCGVKLFGDSIHPIGLLILPGQTGDGGADREFYDGLTASVLHTIETQRYVEACIVSQEQSRIAQEIHDTILQKLFAAACAAKVLETGLEELPQERIKTDLRELGLSLRRTMQELREAIYGIQFEAREALPTRLACYMEELKRVNGVQVELDIAQEADELSVSQKTAAYRILCEAANNAVRHGRAGKVAARLRVEREEVRISVADDGCGFDVEAVFGHRGGLNNMHQLAAFLKGKLTIRSSKQEGTRILVCFPR